MSGPHLGELWISPAIGQSNLTIPWSGAGCTVQAHDAHAPLDAAGIPSLVPSRRRRSQSQEFQVGLVSYRPAGCRIHELAAMDPLQTLFFPPFHRIAPICRRPDATDAQSRANNYDTYTAMTQPVTLLQQSKPVELEETDRHGYGLMHILMPPALRHHDQHHYHDSGPPRPEHAAIVDIPQLSIDGAAAKAQVQSRPH